MNLNRLFGNGNLTIAITTVAATPLISKWAELSVYIINCLSQAVILGYTAYIEPLEEKKTKDVLSNYEFTKQVKSVDKMVLGRTSYNTRNYVNGENVTLKYEIDHNKDDCFGDVFIYNDCDNDNKLECVFVEGENTESNVVNVCDFTKHTVIVNEKALKITNKTFNVIRQLFYPVFAGYAFLFVCFLKQITRK